MDAERTAARIFDLVDAHKLGQAEGALETALAKHPNHDGIRAAQAMVLLKTDRTEQARELALELSQKDIKESKAVSALVHVLQQCCCWEALATMYERLRPIQNERQTSENLLQTYVRMGNYPKAQQTAMQLYRAYADPKYQVWMVQACLGQVPPDSTDHLMLKLSTKLLDASVLTERGLVTPATVRTYVDVLVQQGMYAEAVAFLCSERGAKVGVRETRLELLSQVLAKQGERSLANAAARQLWRMHPDNWTPFELYMNTLTPADASTAGTTASLTLEASQEELRAVVSAAESDHSFDAALALARELQEAEQRSRKPQRGPFLAELALLERMGNTEGLQTALLAYVERFYRKPCCYLDVSTFLTAASAAAVYAWSTSEVSGGAAVSEGGPEALAMSTHTRRILGLRCLVASWGVTRATVPPAEEMRELMAMCLATYESAKPLSTSLEWNEEGHCDAYVTVALNIALRGYYAFDEDLSWVMAGLALMQHVDRRMNNSSWLIYTVCFASRLGLVDTAAQHQLAFKGVQHDTMAHIGYWPLVRGLATEDVSTWERLATEYFSRVERDCSLLRAKVFTFTSWPAMKDVSRFQDLQQRSLVRWLTIPHECAAVLATCQTQKNIVELLELRGPGLWRAWGVLGSPSAAESLVDNADWLVARSVVLGNIHSGEVRALTEALVRAPTVAARLLRGRQLLASLLLLVDVAAVGRAQSSSALASKSRKARKGGAQAEGGAGGAGEGVGVAPYTSRLTEGGCGPRAYLPTVAPLATALEPYLTSAGQSRVSAEAGATSLAAFTECLSTLTAAPAAEAFETFLYPDAHILSALVRVLPVTAAPVAQWAAALHAALEEALRRYESGDWTFTAGAVACEDTFTAGLAKEKARRVRAAVADLLTDVAASSRRK